MRVIQSQGEAVQLGDRANDAEAEARSRRVLVSVTAIEPLGDSPSLAYGYAGTVVDHLQFRPKRRTEHTQFNAAANGGEFDGVVDEIRQRLE